MSNPVTLWSSGYNGAIPFFTFFGNYMYFPNTNTNTVIQTNLDGTIKNSSWASVNRPYGCTVYNNSLYVCSFEGKIISIVINDNGTAGSSTIFASGLTYPMTSVVAKVNDIDYLFVVHASINYVSKLSLTSDKSNDNLYWFNLITESYQIDVFDNNLYVANNTDHRVIQINKNNPAIYNYNWATGTQGVDNLVGLVINNGYLYASSNAGKRYVNKISLTIPNTDYVSNFITTITSPMGMAVDSNNYLYIYNQGYQTIYKTNKPLYIPPTPPCFKKDTKILTDKGYIPVQYLRKGDLVKTFRNEYKAIEMIGKKLLTHDASQERNKTQLFVYRRNQYPEIMEDLVLTGCHSILVDRFSCDQQREKTIETNGDIYVTDKRYRLPAVADEKAMIFEASGDYMIYHFALENEDYYMNYGIYANGLLVETCSKRYLKECSDMMLIGV